MCEVVVGKGYEKNWVNLQNSLHCLFHFNFICEGNPSASADLQGLVL